MAVSDHGDRGVYILLAILATLATLCPRAAGAGSTVPKASIVTLASGAPASGTKPVSSTLSPGAIWVSASEISSRQASGATWNSVLTIAEGSLGTADVSNQDSEHDTKTLACALAAARTARADLRTKATDALLSAIA